MTTQPPEGKIPQDEWESRVAEKQARKIRARNTRKRSIWFGFGTFGMVGWSVVVPTLAGLFLGIWIDNTWPGRYSWTLMLFLGGLAIGCYSAWNWLHLESGVIDNQRKDGGGKDEDKNGQ